MKILLLTNHLNIGGLTTYTTGLAMELCKKGHDIYIGSGGGALSGNVKDITYIDLGITTKCEFGLKALKAILKVVKIIKNENIDLIHAQTRVTSVVGSAASKICNIPYISTAHGFYRTRLGRFLFPCWGKFVIAISEPVYRHLVDDFHIPQAKVRLIYNGTDFKRFSKKIPDEEKKKFMEKHNISGNLPVIGTVSRLSPVKGHRYLLDAFYRILRKKEAYLLLVGDGPIADDLKKDINEYKMSRYVRIIPSIESPEVALSIMDIFILPSLQEGLSLSILEAQASAKPVIATNVGGISQIIKNDETGILVPPKEVDVLAEKIDLLLSNTVLAEKMGIAGMERVKNEFNIERMIKEVEEVYLEALRNEGS